MSNAFPLRSAVCAAALMAGGAAQADVTAAQVWEDWKDQMAYYGEDGLIIEGEETSEGTLTVRGLSLQTEDEGTKIAVNIGDITFAEQGDGSVIVKMADSYPVVVTAPDDTVITILVGQENLAMTVSGDEDAMTYDYTADSQSIALQEITSGDFTFTGDAKIAFQDVDGTYVTRPGDLRETDFQLASSAIDILVDVQLPEGNSEYVVASGKIEGITMEGRIAVPADIDFENPEELYAEGFFISGGYAIENGAYIFDVNADGEQAAGSVSTGATSLEGEISGDKIAYQSRVNDLALNVTGTDIPFPVEVSAGAYGASIEAPLAKSDEAAPFGMSFDIIDLAINDMIWNLFDSGNVLPRDPATIQLDLSGMAKPLFDMLDPAQQDAMMDVDMPFELNALTLNTLKIALAGALITGQGDFKFDNSDLQTFDGFPRPEGDVVVEMSGLNKLMDNLVAMGLVPEDQIMGGRMMLGMFARTTGDDKLETTLEVNAQGQVLANGQRIR